MTEHYDLRHHNNCTLSPHVSNYYNDHYQYYRMNEHKHEAFEIMYVREGKCRVSCTAPASGVTEEFTLEKGYYIYIRGGVVHNLFIDRDAPCRLMNVEIELHNNSASVNLGLLAASEEFGEFIRQYPDYVVVRDNGTLCTKLTALHESLFEYAERDDRIHTSASLNISMASLLLINCLAEQVVGRSLHIPSKLYTRQAKKYIAENYDNPGDISIPWIAKQISISSAYLQRLFKAETGMTIMEYVSSLRLNKAKYLLRNTDLSVVDIAVNVGLGSRQRLTQLFSEQEGMPPGEYRKMWRNWEFEQGK